MVLVRCRCKCYSLGIRGVVHPRISLVARGVSRRISLVTRGVADTVDPIVFVVTQVVVLVRVWKA